MTADIEDKNRRAMAATPVPLTPNNDLKTASELGLPDIFNIFERSTEVKAQVSRGVKVQRLHPAAPSTRRARIAASTSAVVLFIDPRMHSESPESPESESPFYRLRLASSVWHCTKPADGVVFVDPLLTLYLATPIWQGVVNKYKELTGVTLVLPDSEHVATVRRIVWAVMLRWASEGKANNLTHLGATLPDQRGMGTAIRVALRALEGQLEIRVEAKKRKAQQSAGTVPVPAPVPVMEVTEDKAEMDKVKTQRAIKVLARGFMDQVVVDGLVPSFGAWAEILDVSPTYLSNVLGRVGGRTGPVGGRVAWSAPLISKLLKWCLVNQHRLASQASYKGASLARACRAFGCQPSAV